MRPHDKNHFVPNVFTYEVDQYLMWGAENRFKPVYFVEIEIDKKIQAYKLHKSQVRSMRPPEQLEKWAGIRGEMINKQYAEGFEVLRAFNSEWIF